MMRKFLTVAVLVSFASLSTVAPAGAEATKEETEKCKQMIKNMVGGDPSPKVIELCKAGKVKEAMKAAMAGE